MDANSDSDRTITALMTFFKKQVYQSSPGENNHGGEQAEHWKP